MIWAENHHLEEKLIIWADKNGHSGSIKAPSGRVKPIIPRARGVIISHYLDKSTEYRVSEFPTYILFQCWHLSHSGARAKSRVWVTPWRWLGAASLGRAGGGADGRGPLRHGHLKEGRLRSLL